MGSIDRCVYRLLTSQSRVLNACDRAFTRGFGRADVRDLMPAQGPAIGSNIMMMSSGGPNDPGATSPFAFPIGGDPLKFTVGNVVSGKNDKFTVVREFAKGGMAEIYLVKDPQGWERLLKVMGDFSAMPREIQDEACLRFTKEVLIMEEIKSKYVVKLIDHDPQPFPQWYVMEKIAGRDLKTTIDDSMNSLAQKWGALLAKKKGEAEISQATWELAWRRAQEEAKLKGILDLKITLGIMIHAISGLIAFEKVAASHLQSAKVAHRDIKPDNIFIEQDDTGTIKRAVLGDFGIARMAGSQLTRTEQFVGTIGYSAPETFALGGSKYADQRADIFSLGATLYHVLVGEEPFKSNEPTFIYQFCTTPATLIQPLTANRPYHVSLPIWQMVFKAMAAQPQDRYQSYREFGEALVAFYKELNK